MAVRIRKRRWDSKTGQPLPWPTKRRKKNKPNADLKYYQNIYDEFQFLALLKCIKQSTITRKLGISHVISKEIAHFTMGTDAHCANPKCNKEIWYMYQDLVAYDCDHDNAKLVGFEYCNDTESVYCGECMDLTQIMDECFCEQYNRLYFPSELNQCTSCDNVALSECSCKLGFKVHCTQCDAFYNQCSLWCEPKYEFMRCAGSHCDARLCQKCIKTCDVRMVDGKSCCLCLKCKVPIKSDEDFAYCVRMKKKRAHARFYHSDSDSETQGIIDYLQEMGE